MTERLKELKPSKVILFFWIPMALPRVLFDE
jgi:hypothetical protein